MSSVAIKFTAQTDQFRDQLNRAKADLKSFGASANDIKAVNSQLNQFSGQRLIAQTEKMALAIRGVGGAAKLTDSELRTFGGKLEDYFQKADRIGVQIPAHMREIRAEVTKTIGELNKANGSGGGLLSGLSSSLGLGAVAGGAAGVAGAALSGIVGQLGAVAENARQLAAIQLPFERMSGGAAAAALKLHDLRTATQGLVSDADLMVASQKGTALGLDRMGISFTELARVSTILAQNMGQDVSQSLRDLSEGLSKGSAEVLNNVGVIVKAEDAYTTYAARLGKTKDELTAIEQQTAIAVIGFEQATLKANEFGAVPLTAYQHWDQLWTIIGDITARGGNLVSAFGPFRDLMAETAGFARAVRDALPNGTPKVAAGFGPGATSGQYGGSTTTSGPAGARSQFISAGIGGVSIIDASVAADAQRRAETAVKNDEGIAAAQAAILKSTQERAAIEKKVAEAQRRAGFVVPSTPTAPSKGSTGRTTTSTQQREYNPLIDGIKRLPTEFARAQDAANKRADDQFGKALSAALKSQNDAVARMTQDAIRSASTVSLTTLSQTLWGGAGLLPSTGGTNPLVAGIAGSGASNGVIAPIASWATASERLQTAENKVAKSTTSAADRLQDLAQAIGTLSQITGGALDPLVSAIGTLSGGFGVGKSLGKALGLSNNASNIIGGGLGVALTGIQLGQSFGRVGGTLAGAGGGAITGGMIGNTIAPGGVGLATGAVIGGIVGGTAGYFGARSAESQLRQQRDLQAGQIEAEYGGLDKLLDVVGRLGIPQEGWLQRYFGEPREFAKAMAELNKALTAERLEADKLAEAFERVAKTRGMLTQGDLSAIVGSRRGGQADAGINTFLTSQTSSLVSGLDTYIGSGKVQGAGVQAAGAGLGAAFTLMQQQGMSTADILRELEPTITSFRDNIDKLGKGSADSYVWMSDLLGVMNDAELQPFIDQASGAAQIMTALTNTGFMSQAAFDGLTGSITESYKAMENAGKGPQALDLLQPQLQQIWQASEKFGFSLDEQTQGLIDFALESGKIREAFLPATEQMTIAITALVERLGDFLDSMQTLSGIRLPTVPDAPSGSVFADLRQEISLNLDGRRIAEAVIREMPNLVEVYG